MNDLPEASHCVAQPSLSFTALLPLFPPQWQNHCCLYSATKSRPLWHRVPVLSHSSYSLTKETEF